jgi:hypothetical protein
MEILDKSKLLAWLDKKADSLPFGARYAEVVEIFKKIEDGAFDVENNESK